MESLFKGTVSFKVITCSACKGWCLLLLVHTHSAHKARQGLHQELSRVDNDIIKYANKNMTKHKSKIFLCDQSSLRLLQTFAGVLRKKIVHALFSRKPPQTIYQQQGYKRGPYSIHVWLTIRIKLNYL